MNLRELAAQYRESGELCRGRLAELRTALDTEPLSKTERLKLRRKACMLSGMARDAIATSNYLAQYYERKDAYAVRKPVGEGTGISGAEALYQAGRFL